jgi:hypothetical protein
LNVPPSAAAGPEFTVSVTTLGPPELAPLLEVLLPLELPPLLELLLLELLLLELLLLELLLLELLLLELLLELLGLELPPPPPQPARTHRLSIAVQSKPNFMSRLRYALWKIADGNAGGYQTRDIRLAAKCAQAAR